MWPSDLPFAFCCVLLFTSIGLSNSLPSVMLSYMECWMKRFTYPNLRGLLIPLALIWSATFTKPCMALSKLEAPGFSLFPPTFSLKVFFPVTETPHCLFAKPLLLLPFWLSMLMISFLLVVILFIFNPSFNKCILPSP